MYGLMNEDAKELASALSDIVTHWSDYGNYPDMTNDINRGKTALAKWENKK